jgi:hypothetical protein
MDAIAVAFGDFMASFVAGFVVFAGVGVLANATGQTVESAASGSAGLGLIFISFPSAVEALGDQPYNFSLGVRKLLAVLFFGMVSTLGIDSAFSLCEGFSTCIKDSRLFKGIPREGLIAGICLLGYSISFAYCDDVGLYALDSVDYYINICMLFVGYMECVSVGWVYMQQEQVKRIGWAAWTISFASFFYASIIAPRAGFGIGMQSDEALPGSVTGIVIGFGVFIVGQLLALRMARAHRKSEGIEGSALYDVLLFNVESLRADMNKVVGSGVGNVSIPLVWSILVKFFIPPVLMIMLEIKLMSSSFGAYEGYHTWYQGWGIAISFLPWAAFAIGLVAPWLYDFLMPENEVTLQLHLEGVVGKDAQVKEEAEDPAKVEASNTVDI